MQFFCSKCEGPVIQPEESEAVDGFLYSCPTCHGPVAFVSYEEAAALDAEEGPVAEPLFTENEVRYLNHVIDKQLVKLHGAAHQLMNIKDKIGGTF